MFIAERLISIIAPHYCIVCGAEGEVVCAWCLPDLAPPLPERCYVCKTATKDSAVCRKCRRTRRLKHVWVRTSYEAQAKQLIHDFKFARKQSAAAPIARLMAGSLPYLGPETIVVHVPTATSRVRRRGYDHAGLLAKQLAHDLRLRHKTLLARTSQTRQVGAKRAERMEQMKEAFRLSGEERLDRVSILLVDDLVTTGATLEAAATCLRSAGAKVINAAVFAQKQ